MSQDVPRESIAAEFEARPPVDQQELHALLETLGLSPDTVPITFHLWPGEEFDQRWTGYSVEWALIPDIGWQYPPTRHIIHHPWRVTLPESTTRYAILRWRGWRARTPGFLELYYGAGRSPIPGRFRRSLRDFDEHTPTKELQAFLDLVRTRQHAGRPFGSGVLLAGGPFLAALFEAMGVVAHRTHERPTLREVAVELPDQPSEDTVRRRLRENGLSGWAQAVERWEAQRRKT